MGLLSGGTISLRVQRDECVRRLALSSHSREGLGRDRVAFVAWAVAVEETESWSLVSSFVLASASPGAVPSVGEGGMGAGLLPAEFAVAGSVT